MLGYVAIVHIYFEIFVFSSNARKGLQRKIVPGKTPRSVSPFEFSANFIYDSAQC